MWIFSTREVVILFYAFIIILGIFISRKIRPSAINVIKSACTKKLVIPFILMLQYAVSFVLVFTFLPIWDWIYLKEIIIWVLVAGVPVCFSAINKATESNYYRNMILDNLRFAAVVQFITGTFTFSLLVEFILQPILVFFILLQTVSNTKEEYKPARTMMNLIVSIIGLIILGLTIKNAIASYNSLNALDLIISFLLPIVLSILYLPFAHGFAIYAKYERLFIRMGFKEPNSKKIRRKHRKKVIILCGLSYGKISKFENEYMQRMYVTMKDPDFESIITDFRRTLKSGDGRL